MKILTWILIIFIILVIIAFVIYMVEGGIGKGIYTTPGVLFNRLISGTNVYLCNVGLSENAGNLSYLGIDENGNLKEFSQPSKNTEWVYVLNTTDCDDPVNTPSNCSTQCADANFCQFCKDTAGNNGSTTYTSISLKNIATQQYLGIGQSTKCETEFSLFLTPDNQGDYDCNGDDDGQRLFPIAASPANTDAQYGTSLVICNQYPSSRGPEGNCLSVNPNGNQYCASTDIDDYSKYYVISVDNVQPSINKPDPGRVGRILIGLGIVFIIIGLILFGIRYYKKNKYLIPIASGLILIGIVTIGVGIYNDSINVNPT